jgi:hypothetical protein
MSPGSALVTNLVEFSAQLKGFASLSREKAVLGQRKVTFQILRGVILSNPVDTGRMRAGWVATAGAPSESVPDAGSYPAPDAMVAGAGLAELQFGQSSYVVNNVEYSAYVEAFHPSKAGFVQAVVENVARQFGDEVGGAP